VVEDLIGNTKWQAWKMQQQGMPWWEMQLEELPSPDPNWTQWESGLGQLQNQEHQLKMEKAMGQEQGISKVN